MTSLAGINDKRLRLLVSAAVAAAHAYARSVELRPEELLAATEFLTRVGQASDEVRKEFILLSDTTGLTMIVDDNAHGDRSEEHTSALQSLMRISYAVFCLTKKKNSSTTTNESKTNTTTKK